MSNKPVENGGSETQQYEEKEQQQQKKETPSQNTEDYLYGDLPPSPLYPRGEDCNWHLPPLVE